MRNEIIRMAGGAYSEKDQLILNQLDFSVYEGEVLGVVSLNHRELDALCRILTGRLRLKEGHFFYRGQETSFGGYREAMAAGIYCIQRKSAIIPGRNVAENILTLPSGRKSIKSPGLLVRQSRIQAVVREFFDAWEIEIDPGAPVESLSYAQRFYVEIARAVLGGARVICLNQVRNTCQIGTGTLKKIWNRLKKRNITLVFADNQLDPLMEISDRILVLKKGMTEDVFERREVSGESLTFLLGERSLEENFVREKRGSVGETILTMEWKNDQTDNQVWHMDLHAGEIVGIADAGRRFAGEILQLLTGDFPSGRLWIRGEAVSLHGIADAIRKGICLIDGQAENFGLIPNETMAINLNMQRLGRFIGFSLSGRNALLRVHFEDVAKLWGGNGEEYRKYPRQIPLMRQFEFCLARAKMLHARVLVLLSPSLYLDFVSRRQMCRLIARCADEGLALLLISDNPTLLSDLCDRLLFVDPESVAWIPEEEIRVDALMERLQKMKTTEKI